MDPVESATILALPAAWKSRKTALSDSVDVMPGAA
jgi:hypothetical protein